MGFGHLIGESLHADMDLTFHVFSEMASLILNFAVSFFLCGSGSMVPRATNSKKSRGLVIGLLMCKITLLTFHGAVVAACGSTWNGGVW